MKINGNNFGQIIGKIKDISKTEIKDGRIITTLKLEVRDNAKPLTMWVKLYNSTYDEILKKETWIQCITHVSQRRGRKNIFTDIVVDSIIFLPTNES